jgi:hypothetical protein
MNFYIFNSDFDLISKLEDAGFTGTLFIYNTNESDFFTKIARDVDIHKRIKYMVAIRPHALSPEYLIRIDKSIKEISKDNRLQINLIAGHMKPDEIDVVRTISEVSNQSTSIERSKYLIKYIELLNKIEDRDKPDYYVSVTNDFTFSVAAKNNEKMIIGYSQYLENRYDLKNKKVMISVTPILRKTNKEIEQLKDYNVPNTSDLKMFSYEQMTDLVNNLKSDGINEIIYSSWNSEDTEEIINFVREYNQNNKENKN